MTRTEKAEPTTNEDRDGLLVYRGDCIRATDPATGETIGLGGCVVGHPKDGRVAVRWVGSSRYVVVRCDSFVIVPG